MTTHLRDFEQRIALAESGDYEAIVFVRARCMQWMAAAPEHVVIHAAKALVQLRRQEDRAISEAN